MLDFKSWRKKHLSEGQLDPSMIPKGIGGQGQQPAIKPDWSDNRRLADIVSKLRPGAVAYTANGTKFPIQYIPLGRINVSGTELQGEGEGTMPLSSVAKVTDRDGKVVFSRV